MSHRLDTLAGHALVLIAIVAVTAFAYYRTEARVSDVATETHTALCTFKADLERRYEDGRQFLNENPDGIPGITTEDIQRSLANQKSTLDALAILECG